MADEQWLDGWKSWGFLGAALASAIGGALGWLKARPKSEKQLQQQICLLQDELDGVKMREKQMKERMDEVETKVATADEELQAVRGIVARQDVRSKARDRELAEKLDTVHITLTEIRETLATGR